jgi:hypothetical protein
MGKAPQLYSPHGTAGWRYGSTIGARQQYGTVPVSEAAASYGSTIGARQWQQHYILAGCAVRGDDSMIEQPPHLWPAFAAEQ